MPDPQARQWKILIVDDDFDNLAVSSEYLTFVGAEVVTAASAEKGLAALDGFEPTFILVDLSMPFMDGWEMLAALKARPQTADTPVIALTAHAMRGDAERALEAGFNGYISKPFMLPTLLDDIKRCLAQKSKP